MSSKLLKPLNPGETIAVVAPASSVEAEALKKGLKEIESRGFKTHLPLPVCKGEEPEDCKFTSASAKARAEAFMEMVLDPQISAIFSARGGYGSAHILELLDFKKITQARKAVVGYSDITVLLSSILERSAVPSIHGPTVATEFARCEETYALKSVESLFSLLSGQVEKSQISLEPVLAAGELEGDLFVGNLSMLQTLMGTTFEPKLDGMILLLEDISEPAYRVHRALHHLKSSGKLNNLRGLVLGRFTNEQAAVSYTHLTLPTICSV